MFSRLSSSTSPVLNKLQGPFWSKNTQQIQSYHMLFWSLKSVESEESYEVPMNLSFEFFEYYSALESIYWKNWQKLMRVRPAVLSSRFPSFCFNKRYLGTVLLKILLQLMLRSSGGLLVRMKIWYWCKKLNWRTNSWIAAGVTTNFGSLWYRTASSANKRILTEVWRRATSSMYRLRSARLKGLLALNPGRMQQLLLHWTRRGVYGVQETFP